MMTTDKKAPHLHRGMVMSKNGYYWHDTDQPVTSEEAFYDGIARHKPRQLHAKSLHYSQENDGRLVHAVKELVFDIDVTDFSRFCKCAETKHVCRLCWLHIEGTVVLLRHILMQILGIKEVHILWVFSGKKGVHCLVNDSRYMTLDDDGREHLLAFLSDRSRLTTLEPAFLVQLENLFEHRAIYTRALLDQAKFEQHVLVLLRRKYPSLAYEIGATWLAMGQGQSVAKWQRLKELQRTLPSTTPRPTLIVTLECYAPIVDKGPMMLNKQFKLPFSVHDATRHIALPVSYEALISDTLPCEALGEKDLSTGAVPAFTQAIGLFETWLGHY